VSQLQVSKGVKVPKLKEDFVTNTFSMEMFSCLPKLVSDKLVDKIIKMGKDIYSIQGIKYIHDATNLLRNYYMRWDIKSNGPYSPNELPALKMSKPAAAAAMVPLPAASTDPIGLSANAGVCGAAGDGTAPAKAKPVNKPQPVCQGGCALLEITLS
jgi:hypothetical protein